MPRCNNCNAETASLFLCSRCSTAQGRSELLCRTCFTPMRGKEAICGACGAMGNPHGIPYPPERRQTIHDALEARRKTGGPVLLVVPGSVSRAYILRVLRENYSATEAEIEGIVMAIPESLPISMEFKAAFLDPELTDPQLKSTVASFVEGARPSVYEWLRKPAV